MKQSSYLEHFRELKQRLILCLIFFLASTILCYFFSQNLYNFLVEPLANLAEFKDRKMIYTGLTEAFFTYLKLSIFGGVALSIPVFFFHIYRFASPGLDKNEKFNLLPVLIFSPFLFLCGAALVYYYLFPLAWKFFLGFEQNSLPITIVLEARISEYLSLVTHLILAFGIAFQLPIALVLLVKFSIISTKQLIKRRRLAIVAIFAISAVITPPDAISQLALAIPMILLYELSIIACKLTEKKNEHYA